MVTSLAAGDSFSFSFGFRVSMFCFRAWIWKFGNFWSSVFSEFLVLIRKERDVLATGFLSQGMCTIQKSTERVAGSASWLGISTMFRRLGEVSE